MTFSSPVATAEFSKFAGILSAVLSLVAKSRTRLSDWTELNWTDCTYSPFTKITYILTVPPASLAQLLRAIRSSIFGDYLGLSSWGRFFQTIVCPRYVGWLTWYLLTHNYWLLGLQPTQIVWVGLQTWASSWGYSAPWKKSYDKPRQHIKKQRHYFANKSPSSQWTQSPHGPHRTSHQALLPMTKPRFSKMGRLL